MQQIFTGCLLGAGQCSGRGGVDSVRVIFNFKVLDVEESLFPVCVTPKPELESESGT